MDQIGDMIKGVLSSGTTGNIIKLVVLAAFGIAWFLFQRWLHNKEVQAARADEQKKEVQDKQELTKENEKQNEEAKADSQKVDDFLKKP